MADFAPNVPDTTLPNFTNFGSRGASLKSTDANLTAGVGEGIKDFSALVDDAYKSYINNDAANKVDVVRDATNSMAQSVLNPQGTQAAGDNNQPIPDTIQERTSQAEGLTAAKGLGKLNNTNYWAQMDLISRQLRQQYPGYRDYIDNTMSRLTGGTPANELHRSLDSQLSALGANAQKRPESEGLMDSYVKEVGIPPADTMKAFNGGADEATKLAYIRRDFAANSSVKTQRAAIEAQIQIKKNLGEDVTQDATRSMQGTLTNFTAQVLKGALDTPEGQAFSTLSSKVSALSTAAGNNQTLSPKDLADVSQKFSQLRQMTQTRLQALAMQNNPGNSVPSSKVQEMVQTQMKSFDAMQDALDNKSWGIFNAMKNSTETYLDAAKKDVYGDWKHGQLFATWAAMSHALGPQLANSIATANKNSGTDSLIQAGADLALGKSMTTRGGTAQGELRGDLFDQNITDPKVYNTAIKTQYMMPISDPSTPKDVRDQQFDKMYSSANNTMLNSFPGSKVINGNSYNPRLDAFMRLNDPNYVQELWKRKEEGSLSASQWQEYHNWTWTSATNLLRESVSNMNNTNLYSKDWNINYNPNLHSFSMDKTNSPPEPQANATEVGRVVAKTADSLSNTYVKEPAARAAVQDVNNLIHSLEPIMKQEGMDPNKVIPQLIHDMGIQMGATKQAPQGFETAYNMLKESAGKYLPNAQTVTQPSANNSSLAEVHTKIDEFKKWFAGILPDLNTTGEAAAGQK